MATKLAHRPVKYVPHVAQSDEEPFSAADVNLLLLQAEDAFEAYIQLLESDNTELRMRCATQMVELREMVDKQSFAQTKVDAAHAELALMQSSTSWRLTRPVRALSRLFGTKGA